jgi:putative PIN family toxin of toxin-antitoxin system
MSERSVRIRSVVDSNVFVSGTTHKGGLPRRLLRAWYDQRFEKLLSEPQHDELTDVFGRPKIVARYQLTQDELNELFTALAGAPRPPLSPTIPLPVRDPKDEHLLAAAFGGEADYLISGDKDLLVLAGDPRLGKLKIVTVAEFLDVLDQFGRSEMDS